MQRYILSALTVLIAATAVTSSAQANTDSFQDARDIGQLSTTTQLSQDASLHDLVWHNRNARDI